MKKSLILSVVMTLVLVISMSTATFAWYTTNNKVEANVAKVTATTAAGNLRISANGSDGWGTSITFNTESISAIAPLRPYIEDAENAGHGKAITAANFTTATWYSAIAAADRAITYDTHAGPQKYNFYLSNVDSDELALNIQVTDIASAGGVNSTSKLRWAISQGNTVYASSAIDYLTAVTDGVKEDVAAVMAATSATYTIAQGATNDAFVLWMWFDGESMVNENTGASVTLNIKITKAA